MWMWVEKMGMDVDVHMKMDLDEILMNIDEYGWVWIAKKNIIEDMDEYK
jgi:hypothetical protein